VAAAIAVHVPKFYDIAVFIEQYLKCKAAMAFMSVAIVFTFESDIDLFKKKIGKFSPSVVEAMNVSWTALLVYIPPGKYLNSLTGPYQLFAAYKKWYGIVYLMDLPIEQRPKYGLMLDADIRIFDENDCGLEGRWSRLLSRIQGVEDKKVWLGSRIMRNPFWTKRMVLKENAWAVTKGGLESCQTEGCLDVKKQLNTTLFTWWNDIPFVNLEMASTMITYFAGHDFKDGKARHEAAGCSWRRLTAEVNFTRFEYLAYQQWCVLHYGFRFKDVTDMVGSATWGSYLESPDRGARLAELNPIWMSSVALVRSLNASYGIAPIWSAEPVLLFHIDHKESWSIIKRTRQFMKERGASD
jgi:hypothetical protein